MLSLLYEFQVPRACFQVVDRSNINKWYQEPWFEGVEARSNLVKGLLVVRFSTARVLAFKFFGRQGCSRVSTVKGS